MANIWPLLNAPKMIYYTTIHDSAEYLLQARSIHSKNNDERTRDERILKNLQKAGLHCNDPTRKKKYKQKLNIP